MEYGKRKTISIIKKYFKYSLVLLGVYIVTTIVQGEFNADEVILKIVGILYSKSSLYPYDTSGNITLMDMGDLCNGPLWFLTSYCTALMIYCLSNLLCKKIEISYAHIVLVLMTLTVCCTFLPILLPWSIDIAFLGATFMYFGKMIREKQVIEKINRAWFLMLLIFFVISAEFNGVVNMSTRLYGSHGWYSSIIFMYTGVAGSLLLFIVMKKLEGIKVLKILSFAGKNSLLILGFHLLVYKIWDAIIAIEYGGLLETYIYGFLVAIIVFLLLDFITLLVNNYQIKRNS